MSEPCTFCGQDIWAHDPVFVETATDGERQSAGQYCNYACLTAHIEAEELTAGASCNWEP